MTAGEQRTTVLKAGQGLASAALLTVLVVCAVGALPGPVEAADDDTAISAVEIGFHGRTKVGRWTPVSFQIAGPAGATISPTITAPDPDGSETHWRLPDCMLDDNGQGRAQGLFKIGRLEGLIRITAGGAVAAIPARAEAAEETTGCVLRSQDVPFVAVLGAAPGFQNAYTADDDSAAGSTLPPVEVISLATATEIPDDDVGFDALDVVVLAEELGLDSNRSSALADWVRRGGHLVLIPGTDPESLKTSPVGEWAPFTVVGPDTFRELASLVGQVPGSPAINVVGGVKGLEIESDDAQVLAATLDGSLALRAPYGLGRVTVLAIDWHDQRLEQWAGLPGLCRFLADVAPPSRASSTSSGAQLRPTGVSELATQLAAQLDHFGTVARPSYWTIIGFAAAFMLLVGPLDYLLVHRVLKRPRLTWFTFPAWIVFAAAAATLGADRLNSSESQANQFDLVDIDHTTGLQRVQSWMTMYSPRSRRLRVESTPADWISPSSPDPMTVTWSGAPESAFGGMYRAGGLNLANPPYSIEPHAIANIPIGQWSSKAFFANGSSQVAPADEALVEADLTDDAGYLTGTLTHHLPNAITDWCIAYGKSVTFPRDSRRVDDVPSIPPDVPWRVDDRVSRRQLEAYLQGQTQQYIGDVNQVRTKDRTSISTTTYDPLGLDPFPLARILTFFDAADGTGYTGLKNSSLGRSDLSRMLPMKRAVLFGRMAAPAADYTIDGTELQPKERWTFVRIVLPVKPGKGPDARKSRLLKIR